MNVRLHKKDGKAITIWLDDKREFFPDERDCYPLSHGKCAVHFELMNKSARKAGWLPSDPNEETDLKKAWGEDSNGYCPKFTRAVVFLDTPRRLKISKD